MAAYQSAAGPSRYQQQSLPQPFAPPIPSKTPSPLDSPIVDQEGWSNGHPASVGSMVMPEPRTHSSASGSTASPAAGQDGDAGSRRNPLVDLMDSEKVYVEQLSLVIRRVAAAWSRKDFPPPRLDTMFRCVESVYRANRSFGQKLKEIGPNPSSPKALGDLLMRWIDDLEPAYYKYASNFLTGFDSYAPVTRNPTLPSILKDISTSNTPTPPLTLWTLDSLFILPYTRLRYYRKLYARLLRSTKEGRSDHRLLVSANEKLEGLVAEVDARLEMDVSEEDGQESGADNGARGNGQQSREASWAEKERNSRASSGMGSSMESHTNSRVEDRSSGGSAMTSITQSPQRRPAIQVPAAASTNSAPTSAAFPLSDLELRIDPERTIDLFSMQLKRCKLQMNPPALPYTRTLRSSHDVTIFFTPNSTGQQVVHRRAHVFILSDLFIVADWMEAVDKAAKAQQVAKEQPERVGHGGPMPEMWLSYPPLAGKHLMVAEGDQANVLTVMVMRKETFVIHAESDLARDQIMKDLIDCIDFASSASRPNTNAPSPVPDARSPSSVSDGRSTDGQFPPLRYPSPFSASSSPATSPRPNDVPEMPPKPLAGNALVSQMSKISLEPGEAISWPRGPSPPPPPPVPQQTLHQPPPRQQSLDANVAVLPPRGASLRPRQPSGSQPSLHMPSSYGSSTPPELPMPGAPGGMIPRSASGRSVQSAPRDHLPPVPLIRGPGSHLSDQGYSLINNHNAVNRSRSLEPLRVAEPPSARFSNFGGSGRGSPLSTGGPSFASGPPEEDSPPASPVEEESATLTGPATISAQMKCKVFLQQSHGQWKSLGGGKLKLYVQQQGTPLKQLVVESDSSSKQMLISTIVLTDGVERVAKTGVAVEISDKGHRTGIVYMIQLRNEKSAMGLFESLLAGSDRAVGR